MAEEIKATAQGANFGGWPGPKHECSPCEMLEVILENLGKLRPIMINGNNNNTFTRETESGPGNQQYGEDNAQESGKDNNLQTGVLNDQIDVEKKH
jgi:hypothetical protein